MKLLITWPLFPSLHCFSSTVKPNYFSYIFESLFLSIHSKLLQTEVSRNRSVILSLLLSPLLLPSSGIVGKFLFVCASVSCKVRIIIIHLPKSRKPNFMRFLLILEIWSSGTSCKNYLVFLLPFHPSPICNGPVYWLVKIVNILPSPVSQCSLERRGWGRAKHLNQILTTTQTLFLRTFGTCCYYLLTKILSVMEMVYCIWFSVLWKGYYILNY